MSSVLHRTHVCQWTLRRAGRRSRLPERSSSGMQAGTVRLHKIINRIIICINPHKIAYLYLNLPLRTIYGIFFEPYAGGIYTLQIRSGRSAAPILCQLFKIIVMNNRKLLIFASFLLLAGCTTDPDTDNNAGGGYFRADSVGQDRQHLRRCGGRNASGLFQRPCGRNHRKHRCRNPHCGDTFGSRLRRRRSEPSGDRFVGTSFHLRRPERRADPRRRAA